MKTEDVKKPSVEIVIKDKTFVINFISNYVTVQWSKLIKKIASIQKTWTAWQDLLAKVQRGEVKVEEATKRMQELTEALEDMADSDIINERIDLIKEIIETNGYEFDRKWWERKVEPSDLNDFLEAALKKDLDKKKVLIGTQES